MNNHLNLRSIAFYAIAIGSVVALFVITTNYGEAHLQAPSKVGGRYAMQADNLPECLKDSPLILSIQQSGVYLTGSLLAEGSSEKTTKIAEERPSLTGKWDGQQLTLSGSLKEFNACQGNLQIQGTVDNNQLMGKLRLDSTSETIEFTAPLQESAPQLQAH